MCAEQLEDEDQALVEPPNLLQANDNDEDIEDGEFWGDVEDSECDHDLPGFVAENASAPENASALNSTLSINPTFEHADQQQEHDAASIVTLLVMMIAKWAYRYNITSSALGALLKLLNLFFLALSTLSSFMCHIVSLFPSSVFTFKRFLKVKENNFMKYVVCPSCHSLYNFEDCFDTYGRQKTPRVCSYVAFPRHPHQSRRQACGSRLLAEVTLKSGNVLYYPRKYYCYKPISETLSSFVQREGFLNRCELWRLRRVQPNTLCDIYDGKVWEDFQYIDGVPFLAAPNNLALMLNIDWFRPYKHTPYSVGAIYMVVTNLPRSERFKKENVILVGIVPGPSEPPLHMNSYLQPMVDELNSLWQQGIQVMPPDSQDVVTLKAALICVACDIPACRKVLGFCGHMCKKGCSKCTKAFEYDNVADKIDFSGFSECPVRNEQDHRKQAFLAMEQITPTAREKIEKKYGSRFSSLMELAYFDNVRCHVIDPMHNLFLGTAKHYTKNILLNPENPVVRKSDYSLIQHRVDRCIVPSTLGRIPHKIASACASFTADQWKTWTNVFSMFALHRLMGDEHLECWRLFVLASRMLSTPMITVGDAEEGHRMLLEFCNQFELLYGPEKVTPNMHLHAHILSCIKDYGPIYSFWLFSFERYNGLLGNYRTNQRSVELQLMRMFLSDLEIHDLNISTEHVSKEDLKFLQPCDGAGTLKELSSNHSAQYLRIVEASQYALTSDFPAELWSFIDIYKPGGVVSTEILEEPELSYLAQCYCSMYPGAEYTGTNISSTIYKYSQMKVGNEVYGSYGTRTNRSSYLLARWGGRNGRIDSACLRPARASSYFKHSVMYHGSFKPHYFAFVQWFEQHPSKRFLGDPIEIWCRDIYEQLGPASYLPIQRIQSKFVAGEDKVDGETLLFVMPLQQKVFL